MQRMYDRVAVKMATDPQGVEHKDLDGNGLATQGTYYH